MEAFKTLINKKKLEITDFSKTVMFSERIPKTSKK
jgi:hypothetical protein